MTLISRMDADKKTDMTEISQIRLRLMGLLALTIALAACAGFDPSQLIPPVAIGSATPPATGSATPPATPPATPEPTPTASLIPPNGETPVLMCTPPACAPGETYACPSGDCPGGCGTVCAAPTAISGPLAPAPTDWEGLEGWLGELWRGNVNPAAVRASLRQAGMQRSDADWRAADLDGDLQDEWLLVLYDPSLPGVPFGAAGDLWIVNGDGVAFRYYAAPSSDIYDFLAPTIVAVADLTGDGLPELVANAPFCGAHTCTGNYRVIGQTAAGLADLVRREPAAEGDPANTIAMTFPEIEVIDRDRDGLAEIVVRGGTIGSAGAGVVRPRTEVWRWDGAAITLAETTLEPTEYRHHILYEANDRLAAGDLDGALALYEAAINDPALRNDGFAHAPEQVYADVSRFAAFRLVLIDLLQGNAERAAGRLAWLQANHPDAAATSAAATLLAGWSGAAGQAALCASIEAELAALENPTGTLSDMGYGNPVLTAADFCP